MVAKGEKYVALPSSEELSLIFLMYLNWNGL